jgi:hypothetical protein
MIYSCIATPPEPTSRGVVHGKPTKYIYLALPCKEEISTALTSKATSGIVGGVLLLGSPVTPDVTLTTPYFIEESGKSFVEDF